MSVATINLTRSDFDEKTKARLVMVDFWAEWCGPCKMSGPVLEQMSDEYAGRVVISKVDVDSETELASKYGVMSIPTVILFKDGQEVSRQIGFAGKVGYVSLLAKAGVALG